MLERPALGPESQCVRNHLVRHRLTGPSHGLDFGLLHSTTLHLLMCTHTHTYTHAHMHTTRTCTLHSRTHRHAFLRTSSGHSEEGSQHSPPVKPHTCDLLSHPTPACARSSRPCPALSSQLRPRPVLAPVWSFLASSSPLLQKQPRGPLLTLLLNMGPVLPVPTLQILSPLFGADWLSQLHAISGTPAPAQRR